MTYRLTFLEAAKKEWERLESTIKMQLKKKLEERLLHPHMPKDKLAGMKDCYKIKLRTAGYRLIYKVIDDRLVVQVVAIGKRDKSVIYELARERMEQI